jgi:hypothetical protein
MYCKVARNGTTRRHILDRQTGSPRAACGPSKIYKQKDPTIGYQTTQRNFVCHLIFYVANNFLFPFHPTGYSNQVYSSIYASISQVLILCTPIVACLQNQIAFQPQISPLTASRTQPQVWHAYLTAIGLTEVTKSKIEPAASNLFEPCGYFMYDQV